MAATTSMGKSTSSTVSMDESASDVSTAVGNDIDYQRLQEAVTLLLQGLGEDVSREGLLDTPKVSVTPYLPAVPLLGSCCVLPGKVCLELCCLLTSFCAVRSVWLRLGWTLLLDTGKTYIRKHRPQQSAICCLWCTAVSCATVAAGFPLETLELADACTLAWQQQAVLLLWSRTAVHACLLASFCCSDASLCFLEAMSKEGVSIHSSSTNKAQE